MNDPRMRTRTAQVKRLFQNSWTGFAVSISVGALLVIALRNTVPLPHLLLWYASLLAITGTRHAIYLGYFRRIHRIGPTGSGNIPFLPGPGSSGWSGDRQ